MYFSKKISIIIRTSQINFYKKAYFKILILHFLISITKKMELNESIFQNENIIKKNETLSYVNISLLTMNLISFVYLAIFLIGTSGNILVVYVVCRKRSMQSTVNLFIVNLALSDLLICILAVPFTPMSFFHQHSFLGDFFCRFIPFTLCVSVFVSSFTSIAIALNRYYLSKFVLASEIKKLHCILVIIFIWFLSMLISSPLAVFYTLKSNSDQIIDNSNHQICVVNS